jgi:AraC family L-rhamnose operon transcriptional activator RhaR
MPDKVGMVETLHFSSYVNLGSRHSVFVNRPVHEGDVGLHRHDFHEFAVVISGKGQHRSIAGVATVRRGDVFILQPGQWHAYERCRGLHLFNCCFRGALLESELAWVLGDAAIGPLVGPRSSQEIITFSLGEAGVLTCLAIVDRIRALQNSDPASTRADTVAHLLLLLSELARQRLKSAGQAPAAAAAHPAVTEAMEMIEADLARDWSLQDLAVRLGVDRSHLIRLFRRRTGLTPMLWLARRRGEIAAVRLLTTDAPIAKIGREVGWADANYFARRFRSLFGMSPREYREQLPCPPTPHPPEAAVGALEW